MKKNKFIKGTILSGALFMAVSGLSTVAFADTADTATTQATITFTAGELTFVSAPQFDFGTQTIPSVETDYSDTATDQYLTVSDLRGSSAGWNVTAALNPFQNGGDTLAGSSIKLEGSLIEPGEGTLSTPPTISAQITLPSDGTTTAIETAQTGEGSGIWITYFTNPSLKVYPGTAKTGVNTGQIDWYLNDTP